MTYRTAVLGALAATAFAAAPVHAVPASASVSGVFTFTLVDLAPDDGVTPYVHIDPGYNTYSNAEVVARLDNGFPVATAGFDNSGWNGNKLTHSVASGYVAETTADASHAQVEIDNSGSAEGHLFEHGAQVTASTSGAFSTMSKVLHQEVLIFSPSTRVTATFTPHLESQATDFTYRPAYLYEEFDFSSEVGPWLTQGYSSDGHIDRFRIPDLTFSFDTAATGYAQGRIYILATAYAAADFDGIPPVPEPGTWGMLAAGVAVLGLRRSVRPPER